MRQLHLHLMVPLVVFACFCFRPLAFGDIAAHVADVHRLPGFRIVDPKARVEDRDRIAGLEVAETHLSRPGTLLKHRRPEDLIHKLPVLGKHVVNSASLLRFLPAVKSDHFHSFEQVNSKPAGKRSCLRHFHADEMAPVAVIRPH